jgi:hypothetical protein
MRLYVAHEVSAENHARPDFSLNANIHLHGARRTEVGIIHACEQANSEILECDIAQESKVSKSCRDTSQFERLLRWYR